MRLINLYEQTSDLCCVLNKPAIEDTMSIDHIKQFKAGFEEGYGQPFPCGWLLLVVVKVAFLVVVLHELIATVSWQSDAHLAYRL